VQALVLRAWMISLSADGLNNAGGRTTRVHQPHTGGQWRQRCVEQGIDGLLDDAAARLAAQAWRRGCGAVLSLTLESMPADAMQRSTRSLARQSGLSRTTIPPQLVCQAPVVPSPLHTHLRIMGQPGRSLVRPPRQKADPARRASIPSCVGTGHRTAEPDPGFRRPILYANFS
jgi:hypothetical protein